MGKLNKNNSSVYWLGKKISQYSLNNKYIKTFKTLAMASDELKIPKTQISAAALGRRWSTAGFRFKYTQFREDLKEERKIQTIRRVSQYDQEGKFIKTYHDCQVASKETGINHGNIWSSAAGRRWSTGGYLWRFTDICGDLNEVTACQCCGKKIGLEEKVTISIDCLRRLKGDDST